jgi:hypothetical protein
MGDDQFDRSQRRSGFVPAQIGGPRVPWDRRRSPMPQEQPKSRPEAPATPRRLGNPQPSAPVYGDQWGRSGKQNEGQAGHADRPAPIRSPAEAEGESEPGEA